MLVCVDPHPFADALATAQISAASAAVTDSASAMSSAWREVVAGLGQQPQRERGERDTDRDVTRNAPATPATGSYGSRTW
jgi:hypothetical protein